MADGMGILALIYLNIPNPMPPSNSTMSRDSIRPFLLLPIQIVCIVYAVVNTVAVSVHPAAGLKLKGEKVIEPTSLPFLSLCCSLTIFHYNEIEGMTQTQVPSEP